MAATSKCVKCGKAITKLNLEVVSSGPEDDDKRSFPTAIYSCPSCRSVLGVQIDPVTIMNGTVDRMMKALQAAAKPKS